MAQRVARRMRLSGLGEMPGCAMDAQKEIPEAPNQSNLPLWLYPPSQWENLDQYAYTNLTAIGTDATIISFRIPTGRNGVIQKVGNNFVGAGWVEGSGDIV